MKRINWVVMFAVGAIAATVLGSVSWRSAGGIILAAVLGAFLVGSGGEVWRWFRAFRRGDTGAVCDYCGLSATPADPVILRDESSRRTHESCKGMVRHIRYFDDTGTLRNVRLGPPPATDQATSASKPL